MASLHGETIGFVVEDLLAMPTARPVLVDYSVTGMPIRIGRGRTGATAIDGRRGAADLADELARRFRLSAG